MLVRALSVVFSVVVLTAISGCAAPRSAESSPAPTAVARDAVANPLAAPELVQFGQFVGRWRCELLPRADGDVPGAATWVWSYAMDGFAVQDLWLPENSAGAALSTGTALRIYDVENHEWRVVWTSVDKAEFAFFAARLDNDEMVMSGQTDNFDLKMVFHDITETSFAWRYEARPETADAGWDVLARILCSRETTPR